MRSRAVDLTWAQVGIAAHVGCQRNIQCLKEARQRGDGSPVDHLWDYNIEGACAEMAVARWLGVYWDGNLGDYDAPDVGPYQVRCNTSRKFDDMIIRPRDFQKLHLDAVFISVLSFLPDFTICGWMRLRDARSTKWFKDGGNGRPKAWFVPRHVLEPLDTLPSIEELTTKAEQRMAQAIPF